MAGTRGDSELTIDVEEVLLRRGLPDVDVEALSSEGLLRRLVLEQQRTNELLSAIVLTTRYSRGGYDGPFLSHRVVQLDRIAPARAALEIKLAVAGRGLPIALRIAWEGVGVPGGGGSGGRLVIGTDRNAMARGRPIDVTADGEVRIIVAPHQDLWATGNLSTALPATFFRFEVEEGRL